MILRPNQDLLRKMQLCLIRLGIEPATSQIYSAMLYQLSYEGRCREHGQGFSIYKVVIPMK